MKSLILILSTLIASQAGASEKALSLKQQFEQTKDGAYSKWTEDERKHISGFYSNIMNVFAAKIVNEHKGRFNGLSLDVDVPVRARLKDVTAVGYMKAVDMVPVPDQPNVRFSGKNQLLCKITEETSYLAVQIDLKADCVQSGAQWDLFDVRGKATIKDAKALAQTDLQGIIDISNFQITILPK